MDDYTAAADKLQTEMHHLDLTDLDDVEVALAQAKRVRAASTVLVRALARHRDQQLQPQEAQAHD